MINLTNIWQMNFKERGHMHMWKQFVSEGFFSLVPMERSFFYRFIY